MKKLSVITLCLAFIISLLSACGIKKTEIYYSYDSFDEFITVGEYSTEIDKASDSYLLYEHKYFYETFGDALYSKHTIGSVEKWDKVNINYFCRKDGKEVDGGVDIDCNINVGYFEFGIDALEQSLIGAPIGKTIYFDIVMDEDYFMPEIAGQKVQFEVFVNYAMRRNVPTDQQAVKAGFDSVEDYLKESDRQTVSHYLFDTIYDVTTFNSYPEKETQALLDSLLSYYQLECDEKGITIEQKAASMGFTLYEYKAKLIEGIQKGYTNMPRDLVSYCILRKYGKPLNKEDIRNTQKDIIREIDTSLSEAGYSDVEIQRIAAYNKALDLLYEKFG